MTVKSADWIYTQDTDGEFTSLDLLDPKGNAAGAVFAETDPATGAITGLTFGENEVIVISADAPSDADGRPDGTIYIQTA